MKKYYTIILILSLAAVFLVSLIAEAGKPQFSTAAIAKLKSLDIDNIYSTQVLNRLKYLTTSAPFSTAHIKEIEAFISADLFLPVQRTAGNLDTPYGAEVLVNGTFEAYTDVGGGILVPDGWTRFGMAESAWSNVAPYNGVGHAVVVDNNAAGNEGISQNLTLVANTPYFLSVWIRSESGTPISYLYLRFFNDLLSPEAQFTESTVYVKRTHSCKIQTDITGNIQFIGTVAGIGTFYHDLASLRSIVLAAFPNYTLGTADGATGDRYGSYVMAMSDGGVKIYKGPLAGAAGTNDITYTKAITTVIGQVYTVVYTAYSDGTGTGQVLFGTEISAIAATTITPTTKSFTFTATDVSTNLIIKSRTANGAITIKGVSVR